jgi:diguanylate cyclase (GGDEF)-like protein
LSQSAVASRRAFDRAREIRRRFLVAVLCASLLWSGIVAIGAVMGVAPLGPVQTANNLAYFLVSGLFLAAVVLRPQNLFAIAVAVFVATFAYVSAAQYLVLDDQLRMLLFYPLAGAGFLILGSAAGWILVAGAFCAFGGAFALGLYELSPLGASTFFITLGLTGGFFQVFQAESDAALRTITAQNVELEAAARQDPLTGLMNRRAFQESLQSHFAPRTARTSAPAPLSIAFVDVDRFKDINDHHGHAAGDAVLVALADILRTLLGAGRGVPARIGGEEFAVMLPGTHLPEALILSETIRAAVGGIEVGAAPALLGVSVSIGVASSASGFHSAEDLLRAADAAMYEAKGSGRDRVVAWSA